MTDLRYALRFLWTHKPFTATAVLTLALGLGANTALFGLLNSVLRPLALPAADRLVAIVAEPKGDDTGGFQFAFSTEQSVRREVLAGGGSDWQAVSRPERG